MSKKDSSKSTLDNDYRGELRTNDSDWSRTENKDIRFVTPSPPSKDESGEDTKE